MFELVRITIEALAIALIVFQYNENKYLRARLARLERHTEKVIDLRRAGM